MLNRLVGASLTLLLAAVAVYVAVRLLESVFTTLIVIAAVVGGLVIGGAVLRLLWRRHRMDSW